MRTYFVEKIKTTANTQGLVFLGRSGQDQICRCCHMNNFSNIQIPKGKYEILFEVKKVNSLFMNKEINDIKITLDNNFDLIN